MVDLCSNPIEVLVVTRVVILEMPRACPVVVLEIPRACPVKMLRTSPWSFKDATGLSRGVSRSLLPRRSKNLIPDATGLPRGVFTIAAI